MNDKVRLIDANALFNWGKYKLSDAVKYGNKDAEQQHFSYSTLMMYEIADEIDDAPEVDAAQVVKCKDCKYFRPYEGEEHKGDCVELVGLDSCMYEDDFCSYGAKMV